MENTLHKRHLSKLGVWALSFGCSVGWGAFIMPGTTFLPIAGPLGTLLGLIIGAIIMVLIGMNYSYMMNRFRDDGGPITYTKRILGHDHAFLNAWFLLLTYIAIIWANASALTLIIRVLFGSALQFGYLYTIAGFEIYIGELLIPIFSLIVFGLICVSKKKIASLIQIIMAILLFLGIGSILIICLVNNKGAINTFKPAFAEGKNGFASIFAMVALAPWAFIGFESVSQSTGEFKFNVKKSIWVIASAIVTSALSYIFLSIVATTSVPDGYTNWFDYISNLPTSGISMYPIFNAVNDAIGNTGIIILSITAFMGISTGLLGNYIAASRVIRTMAEDDMLPKWFKKTNKEDNPTHALYLLIAICVIIQF